MPAAADAVSSLWWFEVDRPALVLGSTQGDIVVDHGACARAGVEVVWRHSGGGAVLLVPGEVVWLDVILPASDPRWSDDVGRATWWLGQAWADALASLGHPGGQVHRGPMVASAWSRLVCFAGLGPGEVTIAGRKAVGISQRRTRGVARFQCALHRRWDPAALLGLLAPSALPPDDPAELAGAVAAFDVAPDALRDALLAAL
jgi:lipoate-protein ligase A